MDNENTTTTCPLMRLACTDRCAMALCFTDGDIAGSWVCAIAAIGQVIASKTAPPPIAQVIDSIPGEETE